MAKKHTGTMGHSGLPMYHAHQGGIKDKHAHPSHAAKNKEHGTPMGLSPKDEMHAEMGEHGGEGMAGNCCYE